MTAKNASADFHGSMDGGSGTTSVGNGAFEGGYSC
jgi:hypothetical protein